MFEGFTSKGTNKDDAVNQWKLGSQFYFLIAVKSLIRTIYIFYHAAEGQHEKMIKHKRTQVSYNHSYN